MPLTLPRSLVGARPLATDGTRIVLFVRKTLYVVDRRGHVMARWPEKTGEIDAVLAQNRVVVAHWSQAPLLVHDLRTGKSSRFTMTAPKSAHWRYLLVGASGNLVAYDAYQYAKDKSGVEYVARDRIQLLRLPDGRTVTVASVEHGSVSATFGADGLLVASGTPPDIRLITWAKLQTLFRRR